MKGYSQAVGWVIIFLIIVLAFSYISYEYTTIWIHIEEERIKKVYVNVTSISILQQLFKPLEPSGDYRIYVEISSIKTQEKIFISTKDRVGDGVYRFYTDISKSTQDLWKIRIQFKKYDYYGLLIPVEERCYLIQWEGGKIEKVSEC